MKGNTTMKTTKRTTAGVALSLLALLLAGCSQDEQEPAAQDATQTQASQEASEPQVSSTASATEAAAEPEPSAARTAGATPSSTETAAPTASASGSASASAAASKRPGVDPVSDKSLQEAAEDYLNARENQMSAKHDKPIDWLDDVEPLMTSSGFKKLKDSIGEAGEAGVGGGHAWQVSHDDGLGVEVQVGQCGVDMAIEVDEADRKIVRCSVSDVVVDEDGEPVSSTDVPPMWPFVGPQKPAVLEMVKEGGSWKVQQDATGMVS